MVGLPGDETVLDDLVALGLADPLADA